MDQQEADRLSNGLKSMGLRVYEPTVEERRATVEILRLIQAQVALDDPEGPTVKVRIAWMAASREVNKAYGAILDDGGRVSHRLHDAICDLKRLELTIPPFRVVKGAVVS